MEKSFNDSFPPYNTDEYNGITDYKNKIKEKLFPAIIYFERIATKPSK